MPKNEAQREKENKEHGKGNKNQKDDRDDHPHGNNAGAAVTFPDTVETNLYVFSSAAYWKRPEGGPLVTPIYNTTKTSGAKELPLGDDWMAHFKSTNSQVAYERIIAPDWGPSKGINDKGKLKYNTLVYPGRNVVRILQVIKGIDGGKWGLVDCLDENTIPGPQINVNDTPQYVHTVYGSGKKNTWFPLEQFAPFVPIIGAGGRWIEMQWLEKITLPKAVTVTNETGIPVCARAGDLTSQVGENLAAKQQVVVGELRIAKGGIWGRTVTGWIALRFNDANQTDWII